MTLKSQMKNLFQIFFVMLFGYSFQIHAAQEVKVLKTKGKRAIVQFPSEAPPAGTTLQVLVTHGDNDEEAAPDESTPQVSAPRDYFISLSSDITKSFVTGSSVSFNFAGSFGWNLGMIEIGPSLSFGKSDTADPNFGGGVVFDWNFAIPNNPTNSFVPGLGLKLNAADGGQTTIGFDAGFFMKLFVLRQSSSAIRLDFLYDLSRVSVASFATTTNSFKCMLGLETYF